MSYANTLPVIALSTLLCACTALAKKPNPKTMADGSWISISGTAVQTTANSFQLDYGDGTILVEMDDWDHYGDAYGLIDGDKVTVYGRIDDDLFEKDKIEAGSVYVESLNTYFYASAADEESAYWTVSTPVVVSWTNVRGLVTDIDLVEREFTVDTGVRSVTVELEGLGYNPLDDLGFQQIDVGDRVSVFGNIDHDFMEGRVLDADSVVTLADNVDTRG